MSARVVQTCSAVTVAVKSRHRIAAAQFQLSAQHIFRLRLMPVAVSVRDAHLGDILPEVRKARTASTIFRSFSGRSESHFQNFRNGSENFKSHFRNFKSHSVTFKSHSERFKSHSGRFKSRSGRLESHSERSKSRSRRFKSAFRKFSERLINPQKWFRKLS